jgi:hypothetical protein
MADGMRFFWAFYLADPSLTRRLPARGVHQQLVHSNTTDTCDMRQLPVVPLAHVEDREARQEDSERLHQR